MSKVSRELGGDLTSNTFFITNGILVITADLVQIFQFYIPHLGLANVFNELSILLKETILLGQY